MRGIVEGQWWVRVGGKEEEWGRTEGAVGGGGGGEKAVGVVGCPENPDTMHQEGDKGRGRQ